MLRDPGKNLGGEECERLRKLHRPLEATCQYSSRDVGGFMTRCSGWPCSMGLKHALACILGHPRALCPSRRMRLPVELKVEYAAC
jgi:hypothetical protein